MKSSDVRIRELWRAGYSPALWAAIWRAGKENDYFFSYDEPLGPLSILEATCARCEIRRLYFSDCSFCVDCCSGIDMETEQDIKQIGIVLYHRNGEEYLAPGAYMYSCSCKQHYPILSH